MKSMMQNEKSPRLLLCRGNGIHVSPIFSKSSIVMAMRRATQSEYEEN